VDRDDFGIGGAEQSAYLLCWQRYADHFASLDADVQPSMTSVRCYGRASKMRLNGVVVARRTWLSPAATPSSSAIRATSNVRWRNSRMPCAGGAIRKADYSCPSWNLTPWSSAHSARMP
jgi:hypothetical protein